MPRILENSPAQVIAQRRHQQPLAEADVLGAGSQANRLAADGELRAAGNTNLLGNGETGEELLEGGLVDVAGVDGLVLLGGGFVLDGLDLGGAAEDPDAAQVGVADLLEVVEAELLQQRERIVVGVVVVPLEALSVVEDDVSGQVVVAVDDVARETWSEGIQDGESKTGVVAWSIDGIASYLRKTMASRPLFIGTVSFALLSSTT